MTPSDPTTPRPDLLKTPLHPLHLELGAKMVAFAGYDMPVAYPRASSPSTATAARPPRSSTSPTWGSSA